MVGVVAHVEPYGTFHDSGFRVQGVGFYRVCTEYIRIPELIKSPDSGTMKLPLDTTVRMPPQQQGVSNTVCAEQVLLP